VAQERQLKMPRAGSQTRSKEMPKGKPNDGSEMMYKGKITKAENSESHSSNK